jgi:hypothetical protein
VNLQRKRTPRRTSRPSLIRDPRSPAVHFPCIFLPHRLGISAPHRLLIEIYLQYPLCHSGFSVRPMTSLGPSLLVLFHPRLFRRPFRRTFNSINVPSPMMQRSTGAQNRLIRPLHSHRVALGNRSLFPPLSWWRRKYPSYSSTYQKRIFMIGPGRAFPPSLRRPSSRCPFRL